MLQSRLRPRLRDGPYGSLARNAVGYQPCNCRKKELHTAVQSRKRERVAASETRGRLGRVSGMDADGCIRIRRYGARAWSLVVDAPEGTRTGGIPFIFQWTLSRDYVGYRRRCHLVISSLVVPLSLSFSSLPSSPAFFFLPETYNYSCELQRGRRREILIRRARTLRSLAFRDDLDPLERALRNLSRYCNVHYNATKRALGAAYI